MKLETFKSDTWQGALLPAGKTINDLTREMKLRLHLDAMIDTGHVPTVVDGIQWINTIESLPHVARNFIQLTRLPGNHEGYQVYCPLSLPTGQIILVVFNENLGFFWRPISFSDAYFIISMMKNPHG